MTPSCRASLRSVMNIAWSFKRAEPARAFADCLRGAWRWCKRLAKDSVKFVRRIRYGRIQLADPISKPDTGRAAYNRLKGYGYLTG